MLVPNAFAADARAVKTAQTLADAGMDVVVLASRRGDLPKEEMDGAVRVQRVSIKKLNAAWEARSRRFGLRYATEEEARAGAQRARLVERDLTVEIARRRLAARARGGRRPAIAGLISRIRGAYLSQTVLALRVARRLRTWLESRRSPVKPRSSRWGNPVYLDFEVAYGPVIDRLKADVIHAHNFPMMPIAARAALVGRADGRSASWVYDAHEYVAGATHLPEGVRRAALSLEREFIHDADAVITVSPILAQRLQVEHGLASEPDVVLNAPSRTRPHRSIRTVRDVVGLDPEVPLLVYSGNVNHHRGVHTLIEALPSLHRAQVVIVAPSSSGYSDHLRLLAEGLGCADRLHFAPFVDSADVPAYLSGADVGVVPLIHYGNAEVALTNKLFEYMHAGLPVIVSDCAAQAAFVQGFGFGEVFAAEDPEQLARSAKRVLENRSHYVGALTEELLAEHSWESQRQVLLDVYERLTRI